MVPLIYQIISASKPKLQTSGFRVQLLLGKGKKKKAWGHKVCVYAYICNIYAISQDSREDLKPVKATKSHEGKV